MSKIIKTIDAIHDCSKSFKACKVADKRATDFIHDLERLHLAEEAKQVIEIKKRIADLYAKVAEAEANRIIYIAQKGE